MSASLLEEYEAAAKQYGFGSQEMYDVKADIARRVSTPPETLRKQLRGLMSDCPACADDADDVPDEDLVAWILSHGAEPAQGPPP